MRFDVPLWINVHDAAAAAALDDPRFLPVTESELGALEVEVSVLEPPVELPDPAGFKAGRHGIVVERGGRRALLLPQVATEMGWGAEQMLDAVCRKAGLAGSAWRDKETRLSVFESVCFGEREPAGSGKPSPTS
jgi:AmmeMemoRadiSam system protein A